MKSVPVKTRGKRQVQHATSCEMMKPLRLEATIVSPEGAKHHVLRFDYSNLNERWAFNVRMEDVLHQGFTVLLTRADPGLERLINKFNAANT